jgi:hypothetical protein
MLKIGAYTSHSELHRRFRQQNLTTKLEYSPHLRGLGGKEGISDGWDGRDMVRGSRYVMREVKRLGMHA